MFASATFTYALSVAGTATSLTLTPTVEASGATIQVNDAAVVSASASSSIPLSVGVTLVNILITAADGVTEQTYTLIVTRQAFATVGQILCGNTSPYTCPTENPAPWGIVIYADPHPEISGYYGLAMSVQDVVPGYNGSGAGTAWATSALQSTDIGTNNDDIYSGINGTFKNAQGNQQDGNTKTYCSASGNDCAVANSPPDTSAFNACVTYSNGPSGWYLPATAEVAQMFIFAQTHALPLSVTGVQTFNSYWYWSSTQYGGSTNAANLGNLGFVNLGSMPATNAFYFGFVDGIQNDDGKGSTTEGVRCVQALPIPQR